MIKLSNKRCVILDMDGTIYLGDTPIKNAVDFIIANWNNINFYFLTNNTSKSPMSYVKKLNSMGIPAGLEHIISPVLPLVDYLRKNAISSAYVVGNHDFCNDLAQRMPELTMQDDYPQAVPQAVILAFDTELTYKKLADSALILQNFPDTIFLATHPDKVCPTNKGPIPDVGSFLDLYKTATGRIPRCIFGKPDPNILNPILQKFAKHEMVMAGDRLSTDKKLAERAGIDFILVLSGEATLEEALAEDMPPTVIAEDLSKAWTY